MKFISWNVNGLRACVTKGFEDYFHAMDADAFCLQETKLQAGQIDLNLPGYSQFWNYAEKKGYSGTAIFSKAEPLSVTYGVGAAVSLVFYFLMNRDGTLLREYGQINWAPVVLGLVIVGLEVGYIFAYKAG
jgi:exonuclease III